MTVPFSFQNKANATGAGATTAEVAIEGEVTIVTYESVDTGFRVIKIKTPGRRDRLTVVGAFPRVGVGSRIRARGSFVHDEQHGEQFRATNVTELAPTTLGGIEKYLGSGMIKGIGGVFAQRIVAQFGLDTLKVLEDEPHRLVEVQGLGRARAETLVASWNEQRALRDVMVFLQAHGASVHLASRISKRYGQRAVAIVSSDPYRLAIDVWGIGFRTADRIAANIGIAKDSPQRMQAALLQTLRDAGESGHCYLGARDLTSRAARLLEGESSSSYGNAEPPSMELLGLLNQALAAVIKEGHVVAEIDGTLERSSSEPTTTNDERPTRPARPARTLDTTDVYDARMHETEVRLGARLATLATLEGTSLPGFAEAIDRFERETATVLADEQRLAVERAARCPLLVVTGGPGVGKTTIVKAILSVFERAGVSTRLAAPTGRAAKRMSEATGRDATTLHRLLEFDPKTSTFKRNAKNLLEAGAIVVDESSMVDVWMADALTQAVADGARLVLVGDVDQLPSVGPGSVLRDAIGSGIVPCVRLLKIFRQAEKSLIVQNAHRINAGQPPIVAPKGVEADFFMMERRDPDDTRDVLIDLVTRHIPRRFGLDPVRDIQVLTPMNRGPVGTTILNEALQAALNPPPESGADGVANVSLSRGKVTFRVGDKVMQLRNDYEKNVYNGDVGVVLKIDEEEDTLVVRFDGNSESVTRDVPYDGRALDELTLAYACTVHKSQGSEYPAVVIPLLTSHFVMLSKNLVYTAVTRGKQLVVLVADPRALRLALQEQRRNQGIERQTKLSLRIRHTAETRQTREETTTS